MNIDLPTIKGIESYYTLIDQYIAPGNGIYSKVLDICKDIQKWS